MKLLDILPAGSISVDLKAASKLEVLSELCGLMEKAGKLPESKAMVQILMEREGLDSTGIGQGVAIPHGKSSSVSTQAADEFQITAPGQRGFKGKIFALRDAGFNLAQKQAAGG